MGPDNFKIQLFFIKVIENRLMVAKRKGSGRGLDWEFGSSEVAYIDWIKNKALLHSTRELTIFISCNKR